MMTRKLKFLAKMVEALKKGYTKKTPEFIAKIEVLNEALFEKALDATLAKREELKKSEKEEEKKEEKK